ncbi:Bacteriohemerythrin [Eubacterium plexicaudatum ASF492]|uniref:Stage 0 sporulation protein A homolog n=1 Tax=Eubacterium plexicaudatum ASF492 TaxID=1235802 RepID=N2BKG2_9FIRM|nr:Bacteriohemerythrin [Eubacterium plexicaudatum ASF492]
MGNQFIWQDRFNIGVEVIDREHKKLFSIMNRLFAFSEQEDKSQWVCEEGLKYFKDHATKHFAEEEVYMASISYKGFESHRRVHDNFRKNTLPALEQELAKTNYSKDAVSHFLSVCAGWLIGHTLAEDHAIVEGGIGKWEHLLPEEEELATKQLIIHMVKDMFQLNSRLISDRYGGEKFGNGIYLRFIYANKNKEKWEIFMIFEEGLLLETVGKMMGHQSKKMSVSLMNASRYTIRQFVEQVLSHLPVADGYELQDENLLSYEQFQKVFEKPQCSLLFDTGVGYFAYCAMTQHQLKKAGASIVAENAVREVELYLANNEKQHEADNKKKILIIDDSDTVCMAMQELLGEDYYVTTAKSGTSGIRCMTLDRPDLVLLDYEMPVCDGVQVLEMIRSEEDFAKIPVFFLTGRVDKESVTRVMPLRPEGYLLKNQPPQDIKKNIDGYFRKKTR